MRAILVILPNNLGDVIMTLPVLAGLKALYPGVHISFLVEEGYEAGLVGCRYCDRIVCLPRKQIKAAAAGVNWQDAPAMVRELLGRIREYPSDLVINLSQHPYCSFVATLTGAPEIRGRHFLREGNHAIDDLWSQYLYAIPFSRSSNMLHATDVYRRIAGCCTTVHDQIPMGISATERAWGRAFLEAQAWREDQQLVILQPGAAYSSKRWPTDNFIALGNKLIDDGYRIVVTGAPAELPITGAIAGALGKNTIHTAGALSFRETIVLCTFVMAVMCGDTALMHAAAALGKKVVALFGPTSPVETGPYGTGHTVIAGACVNRPCFKTTCATMECMRSIEPDLVHACLRGTPDAPKKCSVFTTEMSSARWRLRPVDGCSNDYVDAAAAALAFDVCSADASEHDAYCTSEAADASRMFAALCLRMANVLADFRVRRQPVLLQQFESLRQQAASLTGIDAFWNALLNIRLNSVPLLHPETGIERSIAACTSTSGQITKAIA